MELPKTDNLKEWALYYVRLGLAVAPLKPLEKDVFATKHGFNDASKDPEQIEKWWTKNPNYNIAIKTGTTSNVLVVDKDEKGKNGLAIYKKWCQDNGFNPPTTWKAISQSGGEHEYWFTKEAFKSPLELLGCIDIRADGACIVAPPSVTRNGKYTWTECNPTNYPMNALPKELAFFARHPGKTKTINIADMNKPQNTDPDKSQGHNTTKAAAAEPIPEGQRVGTLVSKIGELVNKHLDKEQIKVLISDMNKRYCRPPLSDRELETQVFPALNRGWEPPSGEDEIDLATLPDFAPISANDLLKKEIPSLRYVINSICPAGFGILASPPKYYKSFLALQICIAVSQGAKVLGKDTNKTKCLYFDLESSNRRPQERLKSMGITELDNVDFITQEEMPKVKSRMINLSTGFDKALERMLQNHPEYGFVVIDVFKKIRSEQKRSQSLYDHDYADIEKLQAIATRNNVCLLLLHHTTKLKDESDPFNNMGGSTGLLGAADFAWVITREKRKDQDSTLYITGRDIESQELTVRFNLKALRWEYVGTVEEVQAQKEMTEYLENSTINAIKALVKTNDGTWKGTAKALKEASSFLKYPIHGDPKKIGLDIQKYTDLLRIEANIDVDKDRSKDGKRERLYIFKLVKE